MKYCKNCASVQDESLTYCPYCGGMLSGEMPGNQGGPIGGFDMPYGNQANQGAGNAQFGQQGAVYGNAGGGGFGNGAQNGNTYGIQGRNIAVCIILSIVTCGIYGIYWMVKMNDEINHLAGEPLATSGGMVVLLTIVTCDIYGFYWMYKMGERVDRINGNPNGNSKVLYLVLMIFALAIVDYCFMQDAINKRVGYN